MSVTLYHGDCLEVMRQFEDGQFDAVVTDPPYGTTDLHFDYAVELEWIKSTLACVSDNGYLVVFYPVELQAEIARLWSMRFSGIWLKEKGGMRTHSAKKPKNQWELYSVYAHPKHKVSELTWNQVFLPAKHYTKKQKNLGYKRGGKDQLDRSNTSCWTEDGYLHDNGCKKYQTDVIRGNSKGTMKMADRTTHPTQKPLNVISTLVQWLTKPGDTILDPFMGSGTTGVACVQTGRNFVGIEIDEGYFEIAKERIEEAQMQERLPL